MCRRYNLIMVSIPIAPWDYNYQYFLVLDSIKYTFCQTFPVTLHLFYDCNKVCILWKEMNFYSW